ncbi:MAG: hypothetical protein J2O48_05085, partial [Solirubrobacterales bacterium]|nr:hypothetical protein [Solirubrobacterales bacterium]
MSELTDGVVVANPGGITWMIHQAATFARHDELAAYISPAAIAQAHLDELERRLPAALAGPLSGQLSLRAVPPVVPAQKVRRAVTPTEVAYVLSRRLGWPERAVKALVKRESLGFDRAVSRRLTRPGRPAAVIGYQSNAVSTFRAAARHGILRVLDYPIAHFETLEQVLSEEARLVPAYAGTMQTGYEPWKRRRYAEEIATADGIIMLSRYQQSTFEAAGVDPKRLFIAPLGVDLERFTPRAEPAEDRFRVIFCGQITQRKGISYLVEGFKRAGLPNAELLFVGMLIGG